MSDVLVISGCGPYADPWHPFSDTSDRLAEIIRGLGHSVEISPEVEARLAAPGPCELLVVNIGNPKEPRPEGRIAAAAVGLTDHLAHGGAILGVHVSATSLTTMPQWPSILGGRWVRGQSMHPPQDLATIRVNTGAHPIVQNLADFRVFDERYSFLHTEPDIDVLCVHDHADTRHPIVWAHETRAGRVVYDALGHDPRSYDSAAHVDLVERSVQWLLREL